MGCVTASLRNAKAIIHQPSPCVNRAGPGCVFGALGRLFVAGTRGRAVASHVPSAVNCHWGATPGPQSLVLGISQPQSPPSQWVHGPAPTDNVPVLRIGPVLRRTQAMFWARARGGGGLDNPVSAPPVCRAVLCPLCIALWVPSTVTDCTQVHWRGTEMLVWFGWTCPPPPPRGPVGLPRIASDGARMGALWLGSSPAAMCRSCDWLPLWL